ncbi:hypothetical protein MXD62_00160 [Frankia sp. Mgl5]|nr:hypothetical protein [Frankia sp. Mgl5]
MPRRAAAAELSVTGLPVAKVNAAELGERAMAGLEDVPADLHGSDSYRTRVGAAMVARAWESATAEALDG